MLDKKFIGWESAPHTVEVEKGRLKFFAETIGETNPIYTDEQAAQAAGYRSLPIPPTFPFCLEMDSPVFFDILKMLDIDLGKVLHGEQSFTYHLPICAGDRVTFRTRISDMYEKKGGALQFIIQDTTAINQDEQLAAEMRAVVVIRN
ncbi:MAG: MaoC family dehydratase N-terminal domain-containing protein [Anaerolineae bacterium]